MDDVMWLIAGIGGAVILYTVVMFGLMHWLTK